MSRQSGIVCTTNQPFYLVRVREDLAHVISRDANILTINIDPTEYTFKLALLRRDYPQVMQTINNAQLVGQSIIAYLRQHGYAEIALQFVKDPMTRFDLALECADLIAAEEAAQRLDQAECWRRLAEEAINLGNMSVAERAYKLLGDNAKLSFLYLITGNLEELSLVAAEGRKKEDNNIALQNALWLQQPNQLGPLLLEENLGKIDGYDEPRGDAAVLVHPDIMY